MNRKSNMKTSIPLYNDEGQKTSPLCRRKNSNFRVIKDEVNTILKKEIHFNRNDLLFDGDISPSKPRKRKPLLEEMMNSMEFDVFKSKEAYNQDEFYIKLCKGAKRAVAFK
jgi:hypothetical protein